MTEARTSAQSSWDPAAAPGQDLRARVLFIGKESTLRLVDQLLRELDSPYSLLHAPRSEDALEAIERSAPVCVLVELNSGDDASETLRRFRTASPNLAVVLVQPPDASHGSAALELGAQGVLVKGMITGVHVSRAIRSAVRQIRLEPQERVVPDLAAGVMNRLRLEDQIDQALIRCGAHSMAGVMCAQVTELPGLDRDPQSPARRRVLEKLTRDIAGVLHPADVVADVGDGEFLILSEKFMSIDEAAAAASRVIDIIKTAYPETESFVGLAIAEPEQGDAKDLISRATRAMYRAKEIGPNRWALARDDISFHRRGSPAR